MVTLQKLVEFIEAHGQTATVQNGELMVVDWSYCSKTKKQFRVWEKLNPTLRDVRNWLGY